MERFSNIFGEGVDMIVTPDATTRLVVDGQDHEVLTAWSNHPYCNRAEVYTSRIYQRFLDREATRRPDERNLSGEIYEDVSVLINLRNCATLEVSRHRFTATIFRKLYGGRGLVSTGVTIAPGPIAGLLCAPHDESCQEWTVARPYMPGLAKHSSKKDPEKAIGPAHIHRLARPRCAYDSWAWSVTTDWPQPKVDLRSLSPRAVLTLEELLDCTLKTPLSWYRQYNRDFLDLREDVALGQHVVGFSAAEHCSWPKIDRHSGRFYEVTFSAWDRFIPVIGSMKPIKGFKDKVSYHFFPEGSEEGIALAPHTMIRQLPQE